MSKHLLTGLLILAFSACVSTANNQSDSAKQKEKIRGPEPVATSVYDIDTAGIEQPEIPSNLTPSSITGLPRTEEGYFALTPGYYEADFKSYCLEPGTPGPSSKDAYFQAPLTGYRKDIIETILTKSQQQRQLDQKNIQLLLWSVVSRSDFNKLSSPVQSTAYQLLTAKQVFELKGGVLGVVKTVATNIPSTGNSRLHELFNAGIHSYEAYERLAITSGSSRITRPDFKREKWYKHRDGYFVRYLPNSYKQTKVQVYVPDNALDSTADYIAFNPASLMVMPANSNAQKLGIGGPLIEVMTSVIKVIGRPKRQQPPAPRQEPPKPSGHPGTMH
jgi:hypothetical protein